MEGAIACNRLGDRTLFEYLFSLGDRSHLVYQRAAQRNPTLAIANDVFANLNSINEVNQGFVANNRDSSLEFLKPMGRLARNMFVLS
jgi:hypothetical protein